MPRLFTVHIEVGEAQYMSFDGPDTWPIYECNFAGMRFSRDNEAVIRQWVRVAARHVYGNDTQVIFLHTER